MRALLTSFGDDPTTVVDGVAGPGFPDPAGGGGAGGFIALFVLVFIGLVVFGAISAVRNHSTMRNGGLDPMTAQSQLAVDVHRLASDRSAAAAQPVKTLEERLAELDDLAARGVITEAERAEARAKLLSAPTT